MQSKTILIQGLPVNVYEGGSADNPNVLLLHGGGTDNAHLSWADTFDVLTADYHVIAPDYPGYGKTPHDGKPSTVNHLLDFMSDFIAALKLDDLRLVGISMGGALTLGLTLRHPEKVSCLVLIGSYGIQDKAPSHFLSYLFLRLPFVNELSWWMLRKWRGGLRYSLRQILRNPQVLTESLIDEVFETIQDPTAQKNFAEFQKDEVQRHGLRTNYTKRLHEITQPVLIVHGTKDIGVPVKAAQRAAENLPNAELHLFEGAGHWTHRDQPARFNHLLLKFLGA
jgi:pimeloyl-ACP methyl ester carboxylesterase